MERNYARLLNFQKIRWEYEKQTFWFTKIKRGVRSYLPDFWLPDTQEYIEIKGYLDPRSKTKLKRMRIYYPEVKVILIQSDFFKQIEKNKTCLLIPHWECRHTKVE